MTLRQKSKHRGFSLIELSVVVAIMGIISAMAVPVLTRPSAKAAVLAEGSNLASWLYQSRSLAMSLKRCFRMQGYNDVTTNPLAITDGSARIGAGSPWTSTPYDTTTSTTNTFTTLKGVQVNNADCHTRTWVEGLANYNITPLRDYRVPTSTNNAGVVSALYTLKVIMDDTSTADFTPSKAPLVWRPSGWLRGNILSNDNSNTSFTTNNGFSIKLDRTGATPPAFVVVHVSATGEICRGGLNVAVPTC